MKSIFTLNKIIFLFLILFTINGFSQSTATSILLQACKLPNCPYPCDAFIAFLSQSQWGQDPNDTPMAGWSSEVNMPNFFTIPPTGEYLPMVVNSMPEVNDTIIFVPMVFYVKTSSDWSITNNLVNNFPTGSTITLIDSVNLVETDFTNLGSTYTFYQADNSSHATGLGRFYLKFNFSQSSVGLSNLIFENNNEPFKVWYSNGVLNINFLEINTFNDSFNIIDIYGKTIIPWTNIENMNYQYSFKNKSSGIYLLNFKSKDKIFVKKIFIY